MQSNQCGFIIINLVRAAHNHTTLQWEQGNCAVTQSWRLESAESDVEGILVHQLTDKTDCVCDVFFGEMGCGGKVTKEVWNVFRLDTRSFIL